MERALASGTVRQRLLSLSGTKQSGAEGSRISGYQTNGGAILRKAPQNGYLHLKVLQFPERQIRMPVREPVSALYIQLFHIRGIFTNSIQRCGPGVLFLLYDEVLHAIFFAQF